MSDTIIKRDSKQFGTEEFEQIYMLYFNELYRFAYHYIMSDDAQDIVQETFMKIYNNKSLLLNTSNIRAYLYKIVKNSCIDYLKHLKVQNKHQDQLISDIIDNADAEEKGESDISGKINDCLLSLPEKQKIIISLRLEGKNYHEISKILNITVGTVNTHVNRAYKFIKNNYIVSLLILN